MLDRIKLKSWIFVFCAVLMSGIAIGNLQPKDPTIILVKILKDKADSVFLNQGSAQRTAFDQITHRFKLVAQFSAPETDFRVDQHSPKYLNLLNEFSRVKTILETASRDRQSLSMAPGSGSFVTLADASHQYLEQQKRLYLNFYRNVHQSDGFPSEVKSIDALDLRLESNTALTLKFDMAKFQARYNLWHARGKDGDYSEIEYGLSPQDKNSFEEQSLKEAPSEQHYAELIQMMVIRERLDNQWGISRLLPNMAMGKMSASCGKNIYSFLPQANGSYYDTLWSSDHEEEFTESESDRNAGLQSLLIPITEKHHLISRDRLQAALQNYFNLWPEYSSVVAMHMDVLPPNYFRTMPDLLIEGIAKKWKEVSKAAFEDSNLPSDPWDSLSVSERFTWETYHFQRKFLIDTLVNQASPYVPAIAKNLSEARKVAEKVIDEALNEHSPGSHFSRSTEFKFSLMPELQEVLSNDAAISLLNKKRESRFNQTLTQLTPAMNRIARADYVNHSISKAIHSEKSNWVKQGKWFPYAIGAEEFQLAYIPAVGVNRDDFKLRDTVKLYTPDQLGLFLSAKINYFKSKSNTQGVSAIVEKIEGNRLVMEALQKFFKALNQEYVKALVSIRLDPALINEENSPLSSLIEKVAIENYKQFKSAIVPAKKAVYVAEEAPHLSPKQELQKQIGARRDNTFVFRGPVPNLETARDRGVRSSSERNETLDLYIQAMSLLNLGVPLAGSQMIPKKFLMTGKPSISLSITSPLDAEILLKEQVNEADRSRQRGFSILKSLLDQKLAAEVIKESVLSENPILSIRVRNDLEVPTFADHLSYYYSPGSGLMAGSYVDTKNFMQTRFSQETVRSLFRKTLESAASNQKGLIEEACSADSHSYTDSKFKRLFDSSPTLRQMVMAENASYRKYDERIANKVKSGWQKFKEKSDPWIGLLGLVAGIAMLVFFAPAVLSGLSAMALTGGGIATGTTAMGVALTEAQTAAVAAGGIKSILGAVVFGKGAFLVGLSFLVQAVVHVEVNCFELPAHLKYKLAVVQSQLGLHGGTTISHADLKKFAAEVHSEQVSTAWLVVMTIPVVPGEMMRLKGALGIVADEALLRIATKESKGLANSMKSNLRNTLNEVDEAGKPIGNGTARYLSKMLGKIGRLGQVNHLSGNANSESIRLLLTEQFSELLSQEPRSLSSLFEAHELDLQDQEFKILKLIKKRYLKDSELLITETANTQGTQSNIQMGQKLTQWVKDLLIKRGIKSSHYMKILIEENAFDALKMKEFLPGSPNEEKKAALILFAYARDLRAAREYDLFQKNAFDLLANSGDLQGKNLVRRFTEGFSDSDWGRMEQMISWQSQKVNGPIFSRINFSWASKSEPLVKIKNAFQDYHVLNGELVKPVARFWSFEADQSFSRSNPSPDDVKNETFMSNFKSFNSDAHEGHGKWIEIFVPTE